MGAKSTSMGEAINTTLRPHRVPTDPEALGQGMLQAPCSHIAPMQQAKKPRWHHQHHHLPATRCGDQLTRCPKSSLERIAVPSVIPAPSGQSPVTVLRSTVTASSGSASAKHRVMAATGHPSQFPFLRAGSALARNISHCGIQSPCASPPDF